MTIISLIKVSLILIPPQLPEFNSLYWQFDDRIHAVKVIRQIQHGQNRQEKDTGNPDAA
jgi:hypothetical protein